MNICLVSLEVKQINTLKEDIYLYVYSYQAAKNEKSLPVICVNVSVCGMGKEVGRN